MARNLQDVTGAWGRTSLLQRVMLLTILLACAGAAAVLVNWARKPRMGLLFSGLDPEEAAKIVDKIRDADTPYELRSGGTAILVPEDKVYSLRLAVAGQGMPAGGRAGYKLLDQEDMGTSPFTRRINYRRAVEGELAKTIQMLDAVVSARVHIAQAERSLFAGRKGQTSATVALRLKAGHRLNSANIAAVVHLVAGSVEGLLAEKVVIVDTAGNLLSGRTATEITKATNGFLDYKSQVEHYLAGKAEEVLAAVLGAGRAVVRVDVTFDMTSLDQTKETYAPDGRVAMEEEEKTKSSTPGGGEEPGGQTGVSTKETTTISKYKVGRTVEQRKDLPGQIKSMTVAAMVDLSGPQEAKEGEEPQKKLALKDAEELIRNAIGLSGPGTETQIKVVEAAFAGPAAPGAEEAAQGGFADRDFYLEIAKRSSLGILVIGALLALKLFGGSKKKAAAEAALAGEATEPAALPGGERPANPALLRARITRALQDNPEEVRRLFLTWAQGEQGGG